MAKRHCTMTAEEVLAMMDVSDGEISKANSDGKSDDELEVDDPDEPIMEGSDDDFSDLSSVESEEEDEGFSDRSRVCTQTPPPTNNTTAGNRHNSTIPPTIAANPSINPSSNSGRDCTSQPTSWSSTLHPVTINPFTSPVGPTVPISASPLDVFTLFFSSDLMEKITNETNRYAKQVMGNEMFSKWNRITVDELKSFLGFHILMAMNHLPSLDDYWRRDPLLHYAPIADRITRDRYCELSRYLHFADNDTLAPRGSPGYNRLGKVRPVIDHLSMKFAELYQPHCEVAIDEAMIKFQGQSSLKQYSPMKPVKRGIKVWVLADSHNGYFKKFQVYTGKDENRVEHGLGERVVKTLTAELHGKHHHAFFDNFFTSEKLLQDLLADGVYACGTARKDRRGFPPTLKQAKLPTR